MEGAIPEVPANAVEDLATRLAVEAGVPWSHLGNHPGYAKNIWRERARDVFLAAGLSVPAPPAMTDSFGPRFLT